MLYWLLSFDILVTESVDKEANLEEKVRTLQNENDKISIHNKVPPANN